MMREAFMIRFVSTMWPVLSQTLRTSYPVTTRSLTPNQDRLSRQTAVKQNKNESTLNSTYSIRKIENLHRQWVSCWLKELLQASSVYWYVVTVCQHSVTRDTLQPLVFVVVVVRLLWAVVQTNVSPPSQAYLSSYVYGTRTRLQALETIPTTLRTCHFRLRQLVKALVSIAYFSNTSPGGRPAWNWWKREKLMNDMLVCS